MCCLCVFGVCAWVCLCVFGVCYLKADRKWATCADSSRSHCHNHNHKILLALLRFCNFDVDLSLSSLLRLSFFVGLWLVFQLDYWRVL